MLATIAEQERITIRKRQREGIDAAKAKGKHLGRPKIKCPAEFPEVYQKWKSGDITAKAAMKQLGLSSSTFYRMVKSKQDKK